MKRTLLAALLACSMNFAAAETVDGFNLDLATPLTVTVRHSMVQRTSRLERFYDAGVIGMNQRGMLEVRDATNLKIATRQIAEKLIDAENHERETLYLGIAETHKRVKDEPIVAKAFAKRWAQEAKSGWWYKDDQGVWIKKP